jgi:cytochrome c peroxidase
MLKKSRWQWIVVATGCYACLGLFAAPMDDGCLGLPTLVGNAARPASPAKVALGQTLFFDKRLSGDGTISCASCHQPERAFTDGRALAQGIGERIGTRNTPTVLNAVFNTSQFWDGRRTSLAAQAIDPFLNNREHGLMDHGSLLELLRNDAGYRTAFHTAFQIAPNAISPEHVAQALASFEQTLVAGDSPFDRYYFKGDKSNLSPSAVRGLALFQGAAQCASCHTIEPHHALFSDNQFHSLNVGLARIAQRLPDISTRLAKARAAGRNLDHTVLSDEDIAELGRFAVTLNPADMGKFRTPSLRNVALTAPYMHDGSVATLEDAVELEIYYRSAESGRPLILTPLEKADLVEFLKALTSSTATRFVKLSPNLPINR